MRHLKPAIFFLLSAAAGGLLVFLLAVTGWIPLFDQYLDYTKQYIEERRTENVLNSISENGVPDFSTATVYLSSTCSSQPYQCTYWKQQYELRISNGTANLRMRRYFKSAVAAPQVLHDRYLSDCGLSSNAVELTPQETQRVLDLLTLRNSPILSNQSVARYFDSGSTQMSIALNNRYVYVTFDGPKSARDRLGKLAGLIFELAKGKLDVPEEWPVGRKCRP
jgi:hypothetical protein